MPAQPFHLLIADDDSDDQIIMADSFRHFQKRRIDFTSVTNGVELLDHLTQAVEKSETLPDSIILDINMPLMDGMEALRKIKGDERLRHIPVYMVTTLRNVDKLEACLQEGAASFFTKPNSTKEYAKIVEEILQGVPESL